MMLRRVRSEALPLAATSLCQVRRRVHLDCLICARKAAAVCVAYTPVRSVAEMLDEPNLMNFCVLLSATGEVGAPQLKAHDARRKAATATTDGQQGVGTPSPAQVIPPQKRQRQGKQQEPGGFWYFICVCVRVLASCVCLDQHA